MVFFFVCKIFPSFFSCYPNKVWKSEDTEFHNHAYATSKECFIYYCLLIFVSFCAFILFLPLLRNI